MTGRSAAIGGVLLILAACGFQPLHGKRERPGNTATDLAYISVSPIAERSGQLLRNKLIDLLNNARLRVRPVYRLDIGLDEQRAGLAVDRDDSITRFNLRMTARFRLTDTRTNTLIFKGHTRAIAAYNAVRSDYANLIAERNARKRGTDVLANEIKTRLAIYFSRLDH